MPLRPKSAATKPAKPQAIRTIVALRNWVARVRGKGETVALVPTMGALHAGHLALVRLARRRCDRVVVSIFVNPAQFAPNEDFSSYPRTWDADVQALSDLAVDAIWAPSVATMYPEGAATKITPGGPALAGLEDKFRPQFFGGVCTVVGKLLLQATPDIATFGEKDYQQLKVVTAMTHDLDIPAKIVGVPTVREKDGLALSSRNAYFSASERAAAPTLHRVLTECAAHLKAGQPIIDVLAVGRAKIDRVGFAIDYLEARHAETLAPTLYRVLRESAGRLNAGSPLAVTLGEGEAQIERAGFAVDYLEARHAETLAPIASPKEGPIRLLVAAKIGRTRLIDNIAV